jgi:hypothetical protein
VALELEACFGNSGALRRKNKLETKKSQKKSLAGRAKPRSKWAMKTTLSFACVAGTVSPAGSRHDTPTGTHLVLVIHFMLAGVTSNPSQPERTGGGARLMPADGVPIKLEEAIGLARICQDSRCPVMLVLTETDKGES